MKKTKTVEIIVDGELMGRVPGDESLIRTRRKGGGYWELNPRDFLENLGRQYHGSEVQLRYSSAL